MSDLTDDQHSDDPTVVRSEDQTRVGGNNPEQTLIDDVNTPIRPIAPSPDSSFGDFKLPEMFLTPPPPPHYVPAPPKITIQPEEKTPNPVGEKTNKEKDIFDSDSTDEDEKGANEYTGAGISVGKSYTENELMDDDYFGDIVPENQISDYFQHLGRECGHMLRPDQISSLIHRLYERKRLLYQRDAEMIMLGSSIERNFSAQKVLLDITATFQSELSKFQQASNSIEETRIKLESEMEKGLAKSQSQLNNVCEEMKKLINLGVTRSVQVEKAKKKEELPAESKKSPMIPSLAIDKNKKTVIPLSNPQSGSFSAGSSSSQPPEKKLLHASMAASKAINNPSIEIKNKSVPPSVGVFPRALITPRDITQPPVKAEEEKIVVQPYDNIMISLANLQKADISALPKPQDGTKIAEEFLTMWGHLVPNLTAEAHLYGLKKGPSTKMKLLIYYRKAGQDLIQAAVDRYLGAIYEYETTMAGKKK